MDYTYQEISYKSRWSQIDHVRYSTIIITLVLQLQVMRRLSNLGYIIVLGLAYLYWFVSIGFYKVVKIKRSGIVFLVYYLLIPVFSLFNCSAEEFFTAIIRYGALVPYLVIGITRSNLFSKYFFDLIKCSVYITIVSALLMIYQVPFGRIDFFVEANSRAGFERYGSLLGSTTTYGSAAMSAVMMIHDFDIFKNWKKTAAEIILIIGGVLCLSKSFFINMIIGYVLLIIFHKRRGKKRIQINKILTSFLLVVSVIAILFMIIRYTFVGKYYYSMMKYTFDNNSRLEGDLLGRLTTKPLEAFEYYNIPYIFYVFLGIGFKGFSGKFGLSQYPMCHNGLYELVLTEGLIATLAFVTIFLDAFIKNLRSNNSKALYVKHQIPYKFANMLVGGGGFITVSSCLGFCLIYSVLCNQDYSSKETMSE